NFDKISKDLKVPEEKDGKRAWESIGDDDIEKNLSEIQKAEDWGIFEKEKTQITPNSAIRRAGESTNPFKGKFKP
ncbi:hypothetical protein KJ656_03890, partial [bacterium]|nr:hypothetical protein [bacterium]